MAAAEPIPIPRAAQAETTVAVETAGREEEGVLLNQAAIPYKKIRRSVECSFGVS